MPYEAEGPGMTGRAAPASAVVPAPRADPSLDRIAALAADLLGAPSALLTLRQGDRAIPLATFGIGAPPPALPWALPPSEPVPVAVGDAGAGRSAFSAGAPLLSPDGAAIGALCVFHAVPRPAPADLRRLAALAALAADAIEARRTRERAEAEAAARAALLADISHELRTPLNGIVGFTHLLRRDGDLGGEALRAVERIDEAGRGLLSIVSDALDLARLESGAVRLDPRPFSPARLVEDAAAMVGPEAERKGLRLVVDLPRVPIDPLMGDPDRLRQVLLNLLSNAVKFTASGTVTLSLAAGVAPPGAPVPLNFSVEDSGMGIAVEGLSRLFRRFAQANGEVEGRFGGTGLGLAISKTLVEAMGGDIAVQSRPGAGARFAVSIALPPARDPRPLAPRRRGAGERVARDGLRGLAILLAEDVPMNQKLVLQMLAPLGAEIDVVGDGAAAVEAASRRDYALVLMDMQMPVLGGLDAARRIRALGGWAAGVPIVALTANAFPDQLDLCRAAGMDDHLTKPFRPDELAAKAVRWARRPAPADDGG